MAGLSAVFLAVRRRPVIRYQRGSEHAQRLADGLYQLTYKQQYQVRAQYRLWAVQWLAVQLAVQFSGTAAGSVAGVAARRVGCTRCSGGGWCAEQHSCCAVRSVGRPLGQIGVQCSQGGTAQLWGSVHTHDLMRDQHTNPGPKP